MSNQNEYDTDIASLLNAVLNDDEEEVKPEQPEAEALSSGPTPEQEATVEEAMEGENLHSVCNQMFPDSGKPEVSTIQMPDFTSDEIMEELDIRNFATLVTLQTARWHAKKKDRKAASDAASAAGAKDGAFEAHKKLLAGADEKLRRIHKCIDNARTEHYRLSLPWSAVGVNDVGKRAGGRLLPNTLFMDYTTAMARCKAEMDMALADFIPAYPAMIQTAEVNLGASFDVGDYPHPDVIASHFNLSFDFNPIPVGEDFKGLQDAQVQKLSTALRKKTRTALENAMQHAWVNLYDAVEHAYHRLSDPDSMFHYTLVDKLTEQATLLSHLNVTGDDRIEEIRRDVEKHLTKYGAKEIREDDALRKRLAGEAKRIYERLQSFGGDE